MEDEGAALSLEDLLPSSMPPVLDSAHTAAPAAGGLPRMRDCC